MTNSGPSVVAGGEGGAAGCGRRRVGVPSRQVLPSAPTNLHGAIPPSSTKGPREPSWTPDGTRIIASIGAVENGRAVDVKIAYVDPVTGEIDETAAPGAMPALQP